MSKEAHMTYEDWWLDFIAAHEEWRYADSDALRKEAFAAGATSRDVEVTELIEALEYWEAIYRDKFSTSFEGPSITGQKALAKVRKP